MGGRIVTMQRQARELGRLRSGYTLTEAGKTRPVKSGTWILTSPNEDYVQAGAALFGGEVERWQPLGAGAPQWRVITATDAIDAILPPGDPLSQNYERWSKGGADRRCSGETEMLSDSPCLCLAQFGPDFHKQKKGTVCAATTRLSLILPAMPDIGVWRVETHGFYAANELSATVDVIRAALGQQIMVPVQARIEPRTRVAEGKTKQFPVITLALRGATAGQVLSGTADFGGEITAQRRGEVSGRPAVAAIEAGPPSKVNGSVAPANDEAPGKWDKIRAHDAQKHADAAAKATTGDALRAVWQDAKDAGVLDQQVTLDGNTGPLGGLISHLGKRFAAPPAAAQDPTQPAPSTEQPARGGTTPNQAAAASGITAAHERIWTACFAVAGQMGWTTADLEADFAKCHGGLTAGQVTVEELRAYQTDLESRADRAAGEGQEEIFDAELVPTGAVDDDSKIPF